MAFDIDDDVRRDEFDELHGIDRSWFAIPVTADPQPVEIREAIAELIRDFYPTELRSFQVDRISPDRAVITAWIPSRIGERVAREVYFERQGV